MPSGFTASGLARGSSCVGGGDGVRGGSAEITSPAFTGDETIVMTGCAVGEVTVKLLTDQGNEVLDSVTITVTPPPLSLPVVKDHTAAVGRKFSATLSEAVGGTSPYKYSVTDLPSWLTFVTSTRVLSGTPTAEGEHTVTYRVTDAASATAERTFTITAALPVIPAPPLTGKVTNEEVGLNWETTPYASSYEVRFCTNHECENGTWSTRPTLQARTLPLKGSLHDVSVSKGNDYKFQVRAYGDGIIYASEWGPWSGSYVTSTKPPPAPTGLTASATTLYSASLSWSPVDGAVYQVSWRRSDTDKFTEGPATTTSSYTATGLTHSTEYEFRVRSRGDGARYSNEDSSWSDGVNATTLSPPDKSYAPKRELPSPGGSAMLTIACAPNILPARVSRSRTETRRLSDGSMHTATAEIWTTRNLSNDYCVEGRVISESTPGASASSWRGSIHQGEFAIVNIDATQFGRALRDRDWGRLARFFSSSTPKRTATPTESVPYTCASPCIGGTVHHTRLIVSGRLLKHHTFHVYGEHAFKYGDLSWSVSTTAEWVTPPKVPTTVGDLVSTLLTELVNDLTKEVSDKIRREATSQGGTND